MQLPSTSDRIIDYRRTRATNPLLPQPSILASVGWSDIHLEVFEQPKFEVPEHQHTMHVIAYAPPSAKGLAPPCGERWLDGTLKQEVRNEGDIAIIPAHIPHRCNWQTSAEFVVLAVEPVLLAQLGQDWVDPEHIELIPRFMTKPDPLIQAIFETLKNELGMGGIEGHLLVDSLRTALAIHLLRNYCTTSPKPNSYSNGLSQKTLVLVTDYINEHLQANLKLVDIAEIANISPYHFSYLFKQSLGITFHQYILQKRLHKAKDLLQSTSLSIAEIAICVGFCDQSHLTRYFKRNFRVTPKQFRQT